MDDWIDDEYEFEDWLEPEEVKARILAGEAVPMHILNASTYSRDGRLKPGWRPVFTAPEAIVGDVPTRRDGFYGRWSAADGLRPPEYDDQPKLEDFNVQCCNDPKPRISQASGRLFCGSCKRYLDTPPTKLEEETDGDIARAGNTGGGHESDDR